MHCDIFCDFAVAGLVVCTHHWRSSRGQWGVSDNEDVGSRTFTSPVDPVGIVDPGRRVPGPSHVPARRAASAAGRVGTAVPPGPCCCPPRPPLLAHPRKLRSVPVGVVSPLPSDACSDHVASASRIGLRRVRLVPREDESAPCGA